MKFGRSRWSSESPLPVRMGIDELLGRSMRAVAPCEDRTPLTVI
jgi:hypothetical protein